MRKPTVRSVQKAFNEYKTLAKDYINTLRNPQQRAIATVPAVNEQGRINGITIPELLTMVRMSAQNQERLFLDVTAGDNKVLQFTAEKYDPQNPPIEIWR